MKNLVNAKGLSTSFTIRTDGGKFAGNMIGTKNKFRLTIGDLITWFDGSTMWTLNKANREVTVTKPGKQEIAEVNPLCYIFAVSSDYNVFLSKRKESQRHLLVLNPKRGGSDVKAVEIALNKKNLLPERLIIRASDDSRSIVEISTLKTGQSIESSEFIYPAAKYKDYELIDLR